MVREKTIGEKVAVGAVWTVGMRFFVRALGFVNVAILARLLTKEDFGLVALVMSISALLLMVLEILVRAALIRQPDLRAEHFGSAFWLRFLGGLLICAILILISKPAANFYGVPELGLAISFFGFITVIEGAANPWTVNFQREMAFQKDFLFETLVGVIRIAATVVLAFWLQSYWAILFGLAVGAAAKVIVSHAMCWRLPLQFSKQGAQDLWLVARWGLLDAMGGFGEARADRLLLGKMAPPSHLGVFSVVLDLVQLPIGSFIMPIARAVLPGLQRLKQQASPAKLGEAYSEAIASTMAAAMPVTLGMALVADPLVRTVLGDKWAEAAGLIPIAAVFAFAEAGLITINQILVAEGLLKRITILGWSRALIYLPGVWIGYQAGGLVGAVAAKSLASSVILIPGLLTVLSVSSVSLRFVFAQLFRTMVACLAMAVSVTLFLPFIKTIAVTSLLQLLASAAVGGVVFGCAAISIWLVLGRPNGLERRLIEAQPLVGLKRALL